MRRLLGVSIVGIISAACGFVVSGSSEADSNAAPNGGSSGSTSSGANGGSASSTSSSGGGGEGGGSTDGSAAEDGSARADSGCNPIIVDDPLNAAVNTNLWVKSNNDVVADFPKLEPNAMGGKAMTSLIPPFAGSKHGGIWLKQRMPTKSFTVTFEYLIRCQGTCADGIAFSWTNPVNDAGLNARGGGAEVGVPHAPGGAFSITLIKNFEGGGGTTKEPTLALHQLTNGMPGTAIGTSSAGDDLIRQVRSVTIKYRKGNASFTTAGTSISGPAPGNFLGFVGFSAASGSQSEAAFVSSFHGEFADCDLP